MNELMLLAENFKVSVLAGVNLGWQGIGGIILFLTGIGLIYFGIKALKGYRFSLSRNIISLRRITTNQLRQKPCRRSRPQCLISTAVRTEFYRVENRLYH